MVTNGARMNLTRHKISDRETCATSHAVKADGKHAKGDSQACSPEADNFDNQMATFHPLR